MSLMSPSPAIAAERTPSTRELIEFAQDFLMGGFEKALDLQQPVAQANVERLRRVHPDSSPAELIVHLDRAYLATGFLSGAASGAAAVGGPQVGIPAAVVNLLAFTEASVLYVLSAAEVHGVHPEDRERRMLLVMTVMLGNRATKAVNKSVGRIGPHWSKQIIDAVPMSKINQLNSVLGPRFVTKYGTTQGVLVLGKQLPLGIGALLGGAGNLVIARGIVMSVRKVLGEAPAEWPDP